MSKFLVVTVEDTDGEMGGAWVRVSVHDTLKAAKAALREVVDNEWDATVEIDGEIKRLVDCPGFQEPGDSSTKWSDIYFDEDEDAAWYSLDDSLIRKVEILELKEGETCVSTTI